MIPDSVSLEQLAQVKKLKVIFIYLPHPYLKEPDAQAPIGILYLAALLEEAGVSVDVCNYSSLSTWEAIRDLPKGDFYGITVTSLELHQANRFAHLIKEKYDNCAVALGGPGTYSHGFVDWTVVDTICKGDGEEAIFYMLSDYCNNDLKKEYHFKPYQDLDKLPFPARHLLGENQGGNIFAYKKNYQDGGSSVLITSRGCPYQCSFCSSPFFSNNKVRFRSPENVAEEIKAVVSEHGIRQFRISDDMFLTNKRRVEKICDLIAPLDISWRISTRVKPVDSDILTSIYQAGCREISFGIESFDATVLSVLRKGTTPEDNATALELAHGIGFKTRILFMIRTPGQTRETIHKNIEWLERVPYDIICCTSFVPIPGSDIWHHPDSYGIKILDRNLDNYNFYFFGSRGENNLKDIIKIKNRTLSEFNLLGTGKLNTG
mgnify:CR=1 FL=1